MAEECKINSDEDLDKKNHNKHNLNMMNQENIYNNDISNNRQMNIKSNNLVMKSSNINFSDIRSFLMSPCPFPGQIIQCTIQRDKSGFNRFYPKYKLHLSEDWRFLMSAKKRSKNRTSNYIISLDKNIFLKNKQT